MPKDMAFDAHYIKELQMAQMIARSKKAGMWHSVESDSDDDNFGDEFTGKVVEVHSGDCLTVEKDADFKLIRIYLSNIKAPKHNKDNQEAYGWESQESLRKLAIGKKVRVILEYQKQLGQNNSMNFASVFLIYKQEKNLAAKQLEKGLVRTNLSKDNLSKYLEEMLLAEKKAVEAKLCLHSKRDPPHIVYNDLTQDVKQAKAYE